MTHERRNHIRRTILDTRRAGVERRKSLRRKQILESMATPGDTGKAEQLLNALNAIEERRDDPERRIGISRRNVLKRRAYKDRRREAYQ